jgi:signal transduction histidine kinase/ActR/RegA family two-component response regulator
MIASGVSWRQVLDALCRLCEAEHADIRASVVLVENGTTLRLAAAPSLPSEYRALLDGTRIGPSVGSCGTAAYTKQRVIVEDIASDPLWAIPAPKVLRFGLRACFATPVLADDGEVLGSLGLYFLTPHRPTREQLELADCATNLASIALQRRRGRQREEKLRNELAAKTAFLANMSHEIRTPMNAILGLAQVLSLHGGLTPVQTEQLDAIRGSGEHLLCVVDDVLQMAKLESGRLEGQRQDVELRTLLCDVERMFGQQARSKGLALVSKLASDAPARVLADAGKLRQVLINLVGNALKFTARGAVTLEVSRVALPVHARLLFVVHDTGIGISEHDQKGLFHAFFQAGEADQRALGTGLGLAISNRLVECLGGQLRVRSRLGAGSEFSFDLPLHGAHAHPHDAPQTSAHEPRGGATAPRPDLTVLIVDDHDLNRRVLVELLRPFAFRVLEAKDGVEALVAFERHQPQLVLMDLRMPKMDGYEAMQRIRQSAGGTTARIVAVTASAFDVDLSRIRSSGADDILRKPFRREKLLRIVEAQLVHGAPHA